jgi:hypothetical protein
MSTLYTFGCSFTEGFDGYGVFDNYQRYFDWLGHKPKDWNKILAEKLEYNLINHGYSGKGNDYIFFEFCNNFNKIKKNDIVIYQWTFIERFMKADAIDNTKWEHFVPFTFSTKDSNFSEQTYKEILINRSIPQWIKQIKSYEKAIEQIVKSIGAKVFFWSVDNRIIYENPIFFYKHEKKYLLSEKIGTPRKNSLEHNKDYFDVLAQDYEAFNINVETEGEINDSHIGEKGHKITANLFYDHIIKYI